MWEVLEVHTAAFYKFYLYIIVSGLCNACSKFMFVVYAKVEYEHKYFVHGLIVNRICIRYQKFYAFI